jgi:hypothetical protein
LGVGWHQQHIVEGEGFTEQAHKGGLQKKDCTRVKAQFDPQKRDLVTSHSTNAATGKQPGSAFSLAFKALFSGQFGVDLQRSVNFKAITVFQGLVWGDQTTPNALFALRCGTFCKFLGVFPCMRQPFGGLVESHQGIFHQTAFWQGQINLNDTPSRGAKKTLNLNHADSEP